MKVYQTKEIRNIALIGGAKSGKTALAECMLFETGKINRIGSVEDKNTVSDYRDIELERQNSIYSTMLFVETNGKKVNIIDTPGFDDFVGEMVAASRVCEASLMTINAQNGVEVGTEVTWRNATKYKFPVIFVMNQLDAEKANFNDTIEQMKNQLSSKVTVVQYPVDAGLGFSTIIDVLKMKMYKYPEKGGKPEITDIPDNEKDKAEEYRNALIEAAAESNEELMEKFFEEGTLTEDEMKDGIKTGIKSKEMFPVFCASSKKNIGVSRILEFVTNAVPAPDEVDGPKTGDDREIKVDASGNPVAFVFKTSIEPHLGEVAFFKLYSGEITEGTDLTNTNTETKERISQLLIMYGKNRDKVEKVVAGDIAATIKLKNTHTNNTLTTPKNTNDQLKPIVFPEPKHRMAIKAKNSSDDEKLGSILKQLHEVDPTLLVEQSVELKQTIVQGQGELHLNIAKWILENREKIEVDFIPPKIPYRETITKSAKADYRHKKQSGGAGQFGEVYMMIQPYREGMTPQKEFPIRKQEIHDLKWGGKLVFNNCIVGGSIDARFMPAILKGIYEKLEKSPLTKSYARDIVVNVYDGKMHPVDSNEISFKLAGRNAFDEAFRNAGPKILEPIYYVEVFCPEENMGDVMTDLQGRRAIIQGMEGEGNYQRLKAKVPLAEMDRYSTSLSSITSGRATYEMKFSEYNEVPMDVQEKLIKQFEAEEEEED